VSIQELGSVGELVAALATVVTLVYLSLQIRHNTRSLRAAAFQDATRSANEWSALLVHHPETVALIRRGISDPEALDLDESIEFDQILFTLFRNYSVAITLTQDGLIPEIVCANYERALRAWFAFPGMHAWWARNSGLGGDFERHIEALIASTRTP